MARTQHEGNTKVYFVPTLASKTAPSLASITAGTNLTAFITKDGVDVPNNQSMIDSATIDETFDAQEPGSWGGGPLTLTMFRDSIAASDTAWTLCVYNTRGFIVISRRGVPIVGSKVEVYPVAMHEPVMLATAANEMQKFREVFAVTAAPAMNATVAA
jgi:hypothetical protein